jgi:Xaa-Pro aminopeptidase
VKARAEHLLDLLAETEVDVMLIGELINIRYLTGYTGTNGLALIGPHTRTFITDFRYVTQVAAEVDPAYERVRASLDLLEVLPEALPEGGLRLGFEEEHTSVATHRRLLELLGDRAELVPVKGLVERLRAVKEPQEVERVRVAATLADAAFERLLRDGLVGRTEREIAIALEHDMRERGAERASFETIVAAGPHGALPHATPRDEPIRHGDLVVIDWGAQCDGYCSDCTRTVAAGEPGDQARALYDLVLQAQLAGLDAVKAGRSGRETDASARALIDAAGEGEHFGHGLGHGVGLDIHEGPRLSQRSEDDLRAGNVVTVEPGVYLPERFGIRIEDLVLVTDDGCEILSSVTKRLLVIE